MAKGFGKHAKVPRVHTNSSSLKSARARYRTNSSPSSKTRRSARHHTPKIAWELGVLFVLLLVVFAPNLVRLLGAIAPLIPAPQPAFVWPLQIGSPNYNLTLVAGQSFATMASQNYELNAWTIFGSSGNMSSEGYSLQLGIAPMLVAPPAELNWSDLTTSPASPAVWAPSKEYNFSVTWAAASGRSIVFASFEIKNATASIFSRTWEGVWTTERFTASVQNLNVDNYTFLWTARDDIGTPLDTGLKEYKVVAAPSMMYNTTSPASLTVYVPGKAYKFNSTWSGAVSDIMLEFAGTNYTTTKNVVEGAYYADKTFTDLAAGEYSYRWWANDVESKWHSSPLSVYNITRAATLVQLLLCEGLYFDNCQASSRDLGGEGTKSFKASVDIAGKNVCLTIANETGSLVATKCNITETNITAYLKRGRYTVRAAFAGDNNYSASEINRTATVALVDTLAPESSNVYNSTDFPSYGEIVEVGANWSDDVLLDWAWLETNASGAWANESYTYIGATMGTVTFGISAAAETTPPGAVIGWRIWANDTSGKLNATETSAFTVQADEEAPGATAPTQIESIGNTTDFTIGIGDSINLSAQCEDNALVKEAWLATNESGEWRNISRIDVGKNAASASFIWQNATVSAGKAIGSETAVAWRIYCVDYSDNVQASDAISFIVKVFDEDVDSGAADGLAKDGKISLGELMNQVDKWKLGTIGISRLMQVIRLWKPGKY